MNLSLFTSLFLCSNDPHQTWGEEFSELSYKVKCYKPTSLSLHEFLSAKHYVASLNGQCIVIGI